MTNVSNLLQQYLPQVNVMQLATSVNDQSWTCTVHYYTDSDFNLYWISTEAREHSVNIARNPNASAAILVHENTTTENYIVGISIAGTAKLIGQLPADGIGKAYIHKLDKDPALLSDIASGKNPHRFYCLTPTRIVLFDSKSFPDQPRQVWTPDV